MICPVCGGAKEIRGAFASFDGPVDKAVCPRCNGKGKLQDDGEPEVSQCPGCGSTSRIWRGPAVTNGLMGACENAWHDEVREVTSGESWPD